VVRDVLTLHQGSPRPNWIRLRVSFADGAAMDRELLERRLATAERNVALSLEVVAEQRLVVVALEAWGLDATSARRMLLLFEKMQAGFVEDWEYATEQLTADKLRTAV
jgi:hypothetical protein